MQTLVRIQCEVILIGSPLVSGVGSELASGRLAGVLRHFSGWGLHFNVEIVRFTLAETMNAEVKSSPARFAYDITLSQAIRPDDLLITDFIRMAMGPSD